MEAAIGINILNGARNFFGNIQACLLNDDAVLYDSEASGTSTAASDDGSIALSRNVVVFREDEELALNFFVYQGGSRSKSTTTVLTPGRSDRSLDVEQGSYKLRVKIDWTCILEN